MMRIRVHLALLAAVLLLIACATTGINRFQPNLFTEEQEIELGKRFSREVQKQYPLYTDAQVTAYLSRIGQRIVRVSDWPDLPFSFYVILDTAQVNAFALPGGHVYVYTALIREAESEAELAGVLAHEIAHVTARHATERLTLMYGYEFALQLLLGENPSELSRLVANLFATGGLLAYSRKNELEADRLGVAYLMRAGYNPRGFLTFLQKLQRLAQRKPSRIEIWFSTHPDTEERIRRVQKIIRGKESGTWNTPAFQQIRSRVP